MDFSDLRKTAIAALNQHDVVLGEHHKQSTEELIHELRVYQAELEIQNEELLRVQRELEVSRDRFIGLFDGAPVGYVTIDAKNRIVQANLTIAELLGVPQEKLPGTDFSHYVSDEDAGLFNRHLQEIQQTSQTSICELSLKTNPAGLTDVRLNSSRVEDGMSRVTVIDLSEKTDLLRAKLDSDQRLRVISHALPVPIAYADRSGAYQMHNAAHQKWSGKSVVGLTAKGCFGKANYGIVQRKIDSVLEGQSCSCHLQVELGDAGTRFVEIRLAPHRDADNNVVGFYEVLQDLTLQQQVEEAEAQKAMLLAELESLSPGHRDIFDLLMDGKSNKWIATELDLGSRTVERARHNILRHLNVDSINELLVRFAPVVSESPVRSANGFVPE